MIVDTIPNGLVRDLKTVVLFGWNHQQIDAWRMIVVCNMFNNEVCYIFEVK